MTRSVKVFYLSLFLILCRATVYFETCLADLSPRVVKKKALLIATGLPGTGKSYYLKQLSKLIVNSVYLDKDLIAETFQGQHSNESEFYKKNVQSQAYSLVVKLALDNLQADRVVILDSYFGNKLFTPLLEKYINPDHSKADPKPYVLYFSVDDAKRHHERIVKRGAVIRDSDKIDPDKFAIYRTERLKEHEIVFEKLRSPLYASIPFLTIHTDDESPEANEKNLGQILTFLEN